MFEILWLIVMIIAVNKLVRNEKRVIRNIAMAYFIILSVILEVGSIYISRKYQLYENPIDGGFSHHFDWVSNFALLFLIPFGVLLYYKFFTRVFRKLENRFLAIIVAIILFAVLLAALYIGMFVFILVFYGFAP